jgi:DNA-binding transcriptional LysR family regulator
MLEERLCAFPDVELTPRELTSQQQLEAFDEGQLDVGFARGQRGWLPSTALLLVESGIGVSIVSGSVRHLLRAGGLVVFCRLQPASAPLELRMSWRRAAPSSPTVEAFREVVQRQREAIRQ